MYPCFLPHLKHLLTTLEEYFGVLFALAITDFFAIVFKIKIKAAGALILAPRFRNENEFSFLSLYVANKAQGFN
ncbi:MAG: hypothetical protein UR79_C0001G0318 [Candidatus Campbellbacteria bacterium GW2011_GWD1_35_49]|nr:MAG: hypothetical protein UR74_C0001G0011 [Candidatus Campbellbacteria bacterium GW2011_GWD2_35_24]KKP76284.1 MAG: hypothetical protein UR75_C0001G0318 [Candidatus Campbellbacteria bacterium GW2011_GWC2_35_28]KKP77473.1 MAG: hypothetical protein UR76_C0001G0318 [Candidatus Campbellbacteria bacterium GW2011_GWC1_35_31]KKP79402.1 MAG: hypothetical protein UR79_C0001G0318 [Candidatus Campbellbacteria bacterium GW2011_GWD1_35_49]